MDADVAILAVLASAAEHDAAVFVSNGALSRAVHAVGDGEHVFYLFGGMGLTVPVAAGYARRSGRPVVALEGDGNLLMGLAGTLTPALVGVHALAHVLFDNGVYETTGGQQTPRGPLRPTEHALGCGYRTAVDARSSTDVAAAIAAGLSDGPSFVRCPVNSSGPPPPRPGYPLRTYTERMRRRAEVQA